MQRRAKIPTFAKFAFPPALLPPESVLLLRWICKLPPCRSRNSAPDKLDLQSGPAATAPSNLTCCSSSTSRLRLRLADDKSLLNINSVRSANQSTQRFIALTIQSSLHVNQPDELQITPELVQSHKSGRRRRMWTAGGEILVSGTFSEIVPTRLSKADFAIRRAHKSALEERHVRAQILKHPDCQLLEHFLRTHVFVLNMIQFNYDLQFGIFRTYIPADCESRRYALRPPERHLTIHVAT